MADDRPLLVVVGNCQAESFRLLLDAGDLRTQRVPALHELTAADVVDLHELLSRADLLIGQPTSDDYRGLPVGTRQLRAVLPAGARVALVPSLRYAGLHPFHEPGRADHGVGHEEHPARALLLELEAGRPEQVAASDHARGRGVLVEVLEA